MEIKLKLKLKPNQLNFDHTLEIDFHDCLLCVDEALEAFTSAYHVQQGLPEFDGHAGDALFEQEQVEVLEIMVDNNTLKRTVDSFEEACHAADLIMNSNEAAIIFLQDMTSRTIDYEIEGKFSSDFFGQFSSEEELAKEWIERHDRIDYINAACIKHLFDWDKVFKNANESLYITKGSDEKLYAFYR